MDTQIGKALNLLENSPYAENTIIVFTSDHGEYGGSHGLHGKSAAVYEESIIGSLPKTAMLMTENSRLNCLKLSMLSPA